MSPGTILLLTFVLYATIKGRMPFYIGLATSQHNPRVAAATPDKPAPAEDSMGNADTAKPPYAVLSAQGLLDNWFGKLSDAQRALVARVYGLSTAPSVSSGKSK